MPRMRVIQPISATTIDSVLAPPDKDSKTDNDTGHARQENKRLFIDHFGHESDNNAFSRDENDAKLSDRPELPSAGWGVQLRRAYVR